MGGHPDLEIAHGLLNGARARLRDGQLDAAASMAERARDLLLAHDAVGPACEAARLAARTRGRRGDLGGARALYEWVADEGAAAELPHEVALARIELGGIAESVGDLRQALAEHDGALAAAVAAGRVELAAMARGNLGRLRQRTGELEEARADLEASRAGFVAAGEPSGAINATICIGDLCRQQGDRGGAREAFEQALEQAREIGHARLASLAALNLGHAARDEGDRDAAARAFEQAASMAEQTRDPFVIGGARLGLGLVLAEVGPISVALEHFEASEAVFLAAGNAQAAIAATVNAAALSCRLGDLHRGHERMTQALELLEAMGDGRGAHEIGLALTEVCVAMGRLADAEELLARFADAGRFAVRLERRRQHIEARLALRALQIDAASAAVAAADDDGLQGADAFAQRVAQLEVDLLAGKRGVLDEAMALADAADPRSSPREAAAARALAGTVALWLGLLDLALPLLERAVTSWREVGELMGLCGALDARARAQLLAGATVDVQELRTVAIVIRDGGAVDAADSLTLVIALAEHVAAVSRDERVEDLAPLAQTLAARTRRGHRLAVWTDLHLIARVLGDAEALEEADTLGADGAPAAPMWRLGAAWP